MKNKSGHILLLITIIIWGITFISTKVLLEKIDPISILFIRFLIAYILLIIFYPHFEKFKNIKEELIFLCLGLSGVTLYFLFENLALTFTQASNVGFLSATVPIFTILIAHFTTEDEKITPKLIYGFIVAFSGVGMVIYNGSQILKLNPLGDILAILAPIMWSIYSVLLKKIGNRYHYLYMTRKIFFYGLLTILPLLFIFKSNMNFQLVFHPKIIFNLLFLSVAASFLCFIMWNKAVHIVGVVKASNYIYLIPLITLIVSKIVLNEKITKYGIIGSSLILLGVYISDKGYIEISKLFKIFKKSS